MQVYVVVNVTSGRYLEDARYMDYTSNPLEAIHFQTEESAMSIARDCYSHASDDEYSVQMLDIAVQAYLPKLVAAPWVGKFVIEVNGFNTRSFYKRVSSELWGFTLVNDPSQAYHFTSMEDAAPIADVMRGLIHSYGGSTTVSIIKF